MNEKRGGGERPQFRITDEEVLANPNLWDGYVNERVAAIKDGQPVWKIRSLHGLGAGELEPPVYEYYIDGGSQPVGYAYGELEEGFWAFRTPHGDESGPQKINHERVDTLRDAQIILEEHQSETFPY